MLLGVTTGCGYTTAELYPQQYRTVAVPIAQNRTFYRGIEDVLTEALVKQVEQRTPYKRVASNVADTLLLVTVTDVRESRISRTRTGGLPQELETLIFVSVEWRDLATGEPILTRRGLSGPGRYIPAGEIADRSEYAQWTAVDGLADRIVSALREDW
ncbi:MAG: LPS assembly lipoprotein LptE [Planctomycetota bacterium]